MNGPLASASMTLTSAFLFLLFPIFFCFIDMHNHNQLSSPLSLPCHTGGWVVLGCFHQSSDVMSLLVGQRGSTNVEVLGKV